MPLTKDPWSQICANLHSVQIL